jgi:hypothetical protein
LHNEELHDFHSSSNIITVINEEWDGRGMWHTWASRKVHIRFHWGNIKEKEHLVDLDVHGRIIIE